MGDSLWTLRILFTVILVAVMCMIYRARRGKRVTIRRLPGLSNIDEAVGRTVEMGRPAVFGCGIFGLDSVPTLAALALMQYVAGLCAKLGTRLIVPICVENVLPAAQSICEEAWKAQGREDQYDEDDVLFLPGGQLYYAIASLGIMQRENVAAGFYFGHWEAESIMFGETGQALGAIQIAGTEQLFQIPFFIATCDYVLIAEEFYAASAYLSGDPVMVGSIAGQDVAKVVFTAIVVLLALSATVAAVAGMEPLSSWLSVLLSK
jgi:hypothetical protein